MIEKIADLPGNVLGFTASGKVTADDYESVLSEGMVVGIEEVGV